MVAPLDAIKTRAATDGTTLTTSTTDDANSGASAAKAAETAIVFINSNAGEGYITVEGNAGDRATLDPYHNGNQLVQAVANVNQKTIVVIHSVGPLILEPILNLPTVIGVIWAGIPGQESGNGLVDVLYGSVSPNGKLPYTIAKSVGDYGMGPVGGDDNFPEGLYIDYRHFDKYNIQPRYEFGFGLCKSFPFILPTSHTSTHSPLSTAYTNFAYSGLATNYFDRSTGSTNNAPGGVSGLYNTVATVTATIENTGSVAGAEVAQLYIGLPSSAPASPPKQLRGFQKVFLGGGAKATVTFNLRRKDLSYWDVGAQKWVVPSGGFGVFVGASSRDIRLQGGL